MVLGVLSRGRQQPARSIKDDSDFSADPIIPQNRKSGKKGGSRALSLLAWVLPQDFIAAGG